MKNLLHIAWATVGNIIERVVARKIDPARLERLRVQRPPTNVRD